MRSKLARVLVVVLLVVSLAGFIYAVLNFEAIYDWYRLRGYQPPPAIASLATQDSMTENAKHIFYVNHPKLVGDSATFREECTINEQTIVLGCYQAGENGIFLYDVKDARLSGVEQVTAAHEMLHGAYERLSGQEKLKIDSWLNDYYTHDVHDQRIIDTMNAYKKTEPNDVVNEMHSIFGTEIGSLPANLETYYQRYFTNRAAIVAFADGYQAEFSSRVEKINTMEQQLKELKQTISDEEANLNGQREAVDADRNRLNDLQSSGQYAAYNAAVPGFNNEIDAYNKGIAQLRTHIAAYNNLVAQHNQLASELRSLYSSIDTSLAPQSAR